jgi:peptidoglycan/xylan/chitin deacetylase (PgdA/CDA1 family)
MTGRIPTLTPQLLDFLAVNRIRATFYLIGSRVARHPQLAARIAAEGHEIGNHTWSHPSLFGHSDGGVLSQIDRTNEAVYTATGRLPVTMRPPYGNLYPRQRLMLHQARGMPTVLWSVDPEDWRRPGSSASSPTASSARAIPAGWCWPMTSTGRPCAPCPRRSRGCMRGVSASSRCPN